MFGAGRLTFVDAVASVGLEERRISPVGLYRNSAPRACRQSWEWGLSPMET
jgi:hypothetical protein